ncbi:MAG: hypothetical protein QM484_06760 [Woeseiaceae bacterium]
MKMKFIFLIILSMMTCQAFAEDTLEMEGISIVGNSELPKSLYIVPWKSPDRRASAGKPVNSLISEILAPVEREAFQRRLKYFGAK